MARACGSAPGDPGAQRSALADQALLHRGPPFDGQLLAKLAALVRLVIKRLRDGRRSTNFADRAHLHMEVSCFCADVQAIAHMNFA